MKQERRRCENKHVPSIKLVIAVGNGGVFSESLGSCSTPNCPSKEQNRGAFMSWLPSSVDQHLCPFGCCVAPMVPAMRAGVRSERNLGQSIAAGAGVGGGLGGQKGPCHGLERSVSRLGLKGQL